MSSSFRLHADGIYRCEAFQQFLWQEHGFGTRTASVGTPVTLKQIHSSKVVRATHGLQDRSEEGDALVTDEAGLCLGIRTADCVPLLLLDSKTRAVAAVHAGWRGSAAEIARCALARMQSDFGTHPADVFAAIGPCIRVCCYEVGTEVAERFSALFPEWGEEEQASRCIDLPEANRRQLVSAGVPEDRIFDSCLCTTCQPEQFFSYRREPENPGRLVSAISRLA